MEFVKQYQGISIFSYFFINHHHCPHFSFLELFSFYDFKTEKVGVSEFILHAGLYDEWYYGGEEAS